MMFIFKFIVYYILPVINVFIFIGWLTVTYLNFDPPGCCAETKYIDALQLHIMMIEVAIILVSVVLIFLGYFGYQNIKETAVTEAVKEASKIQSAFAGSVFDQTLESEQ